MFARRWDGSPLAFRKIRICLLNLLSLVTTRPATELLDRTSRAGATPPSLRAC